LSGIALLIIVLITLLKIVVGVVRAVRVVIVYVPKSNKGYLPLIKTCLLALLSLSLTSTLNARKLTSKWYPLRGPPALRFKSLPFSIILNYRIIRLVVIFIRTRIVIVIASPTIRATF
jgi:hypothetical protein